MSWFWTKVTNGTQGISWETLLAEIKALPVNQLWRHNQAGDLPGLGNSIAPRMLADLVEANRGKRGFTYTHKPMGIKSNQLAVKQANVAGFTVNLSGNNLAHADELAALQIGPVVVVLPANQEGNTLTPAGRKVVQCPATRNDREITCAQCQLCRKANRSCIVGFPAHGAMKRTVSAIAVNH